MAVVRADLGACQGYANCMTDAADYFDIDDDGVVVVLRSTVPDEHRGRVEEAARSCPVNALVVVDEDPS
ncbi:ferredoxin [Pseudonocardia sp.]|jgi:ferredoxin|uniref:ferredoxin n=1 Tax=Pseudonocardia sp. TaxID=60912 RepID=UPI00260C340F|nr:ferredoxin [Pseudonocardia sp.]